MRDCLFESPPLVIVNDEKPINWKHLSDLGRHTIYPLGSLRVQTETPNARGLPNHARRRYG